MKLPGEPTFSPPSPTINAAYPAAPVTAGGADVFLGEEEEKSVL